MSAKLLVPFGLKEGRLYEPLQVPNGKACGCVCPACKHPLVARQNASTPHFAHAQDENCTKGLETAVHLAAKQLIADRMELWLPALNYLNIWSKEQKRQTLHVGHLEPLHAVELECWLEDMRPDVVATIDNQQYLVEIAVTHFVDEDKMEKVRQRNIPTIEIDASELKKSFTFEVLEELLFSASTQSTWLYHPERERFALDAQKQYQEEVEAEEKAKQLAKQERDEKFRKYRELKPKDKLSLNLKKIGLKEEQMKLLSAFVPWDNSFGVPRIVWQSAVLVFIAKEEEEQGWGDYLPCHVYADDCLAWLRQIFTVKPPVENGDSIAVWKYMKHLESLGMLKYLMNKQFDLMLRRMQWDWLTAQIRNKTLSIK